MNAGSRVVERNWALLALGNKAEARKGIDRVLAAGKVPQRSGDGRAHLTLVTCAGTFQHSMGTHDRRLAVFATRVA